jgi:hypothetical protein
MNYEGKYKYLAFGSADRYKVSVRENGENNDSICYAIIVPFGFTLLKR